MTPRSPERGVIDRRTLLKGAVAAGVGAVAYSAPVVSVVPAYAQATLVSYTVESTDICVWFSPNQNGTGALNYGRWHGDMYTPASPTKLVALTNNWNRRKQGTPPTFSNTNLANDLCWPPSLAIAVFVAPPGTPQNATTVAQYARWVTFEGIPDDFLATQVADPTTSCSPYSRTSSVVPWSGGGVLITLWDTKCEMVVTGTVLVGTTPVALGPYCNAGNEGIGTTCVPANADPSSPPPATWAAGSSLSQIGSPTSAGVQPNGNVGGGVFQGAAYYHSGMPGIGQSDRCKWSLIFQVRCRS